MAFDGFFGRSSKGQSVRPEPCQASFGLRQKTAQAIQHEQAAVDGCLTQAGENRVTIQLLDGVEAVECVDRLAA